MLAAASFTAKARSAARLPHQERGVRIGAAGQNSVEVPVPRRAWHPERPKKGDGVPSPGFSFLSPGRCDAASKLPAILRLHGRMNRHIGAAVGFGLEGYDPVMEREDRVVPAKADARTGAPLGAALADKDVAGKHLLAATSAKAASTDRGRSATSRLLFVSHCLSFLALCRSLSGAAWRRRSDVGDLRHSATR
jgi:hypothetical protein